MRRALSRVRHDLMTPLNGIVGYTAMLAEDAQALGREEMLPGLARVEGGAREVVDAIQRVLRPAPGEPPPPRDADALAALVRAACGSAAGRMAAEVDALTRAADAGGADDPLLPDLRRVAECAALLRSLLGDVADLYRG